ncbi:AEC family transporter [uncultured Desulfobacter sp.]|uniref:AEC family transporter n=1 Tax=uncultured Desulfobacter sp. TaxID=240139 RepID=UPI002AAC4396|nr:AEC family transporter [uncultured Desulfobacter sp.]
MFFQAGITVFNAIFQLLLISLTAGICVRQHWVSRDQIKSLSAVTINVFLPCLIMAKTLTQFHPQAMPDWWLLPLAGVALVLPGLFFSALLFRFKPDKKHFMAMSGMQNALFIVLPIGHLLFPEQFNLFALYCFLLVMGVTPVMWSLGKVMLAPDTHDGFHLKSLMTPPLVAIVISVGLVFEGLSPLVPHTVIASMTLLGEAAIPLAIFILGGTLGAISIGDIPDLKDIFIVFIVKFVLVPGCVFTLLRFTKDLLSSSLICSMLMVQAASPPATNLVLIAENYGGDTRAISSMMLIQYLIAIVVMPVWIALWQYSACLD